MLPTSPPLNKSQLIIELKTQGVSIKRDCEEIDNLLNSSIDGLEL